MQCLAVLLTVLVALLAFGAHAYGAPPCNCGIGNVEAEAPRCICACSADYLQPNCLFTVTDRVRMDIWIKLPSEQFSSSAFAFTLQTSLGAPAGSVVFDWASTSKNKTNAFYTMNGIDAQQLMRDWETNHWWIRKAEIESVFHDIKRPAPVAPLQQVAVWYKDDTIEINSETTAWLLGAIILFLFATCVECCFMKNTEDVIIQKEAAQQEIINAGGHLAVAPNPFVSQRPTDGNESMKKKRRKKAAGDASGVEESDLILDV